MASRRLLAIVLVLLAVAWPVAADDGTDPAPSSDPSAPPTGGPTTDPAADGLGSSGTPSTAVSCVFVLFDCQSVTGEPVVGASCDLYEFNPDLSQSPMNVLRIDPDGCVRGFIRRTLGWPPIEVSTALTPTWPF